MLSNRFITSAILSLLFTISSITSTAQTQEDFDKKMQEVYTNTIDKAKKATIAKEMYNMVEKKKELQTYANYYLLKTIYEKQVGNDAMAKTCEEKAQKIMNAMVGVNNQAVPDTSNPTMAWATYYFPSLFRNNDPKNAEKALQFMNSHPDFKTFSNYTFIGYAFERHSDFINAKENYQAAMPLAGNDREEYHSYMYYTNFLTRTGDYQLCTTLQKVVRPLLYFYQNVRQQQYKMFGHFSLQDHRSYWLIYYLSMFYVLA